MTRVKSHWSHGLLYEKASTTQCTNLFIIIEFGATLYATFPIGICETIFGFGERGSRARN